MHKKRVQINETPYGDTFMHKKRVQINETPYGYTFMHKKHVQINESGMDDVKGSICDHAHGQKNGGN